MPTLLIADDSMFQRMVLGKLAKAEGFSVLEAKNGQECLDMVDACGPDALVLDLNMPEVDGLEVMSRLQACGRNLPVLVLTADIQHSTHQRCVALGATAVINKPLDEAVFRAKLKGLSF